MNEEFENKKAFEDRQNDGGLDGRQLSDDFIIGQDFFIDSSDADDMVRQDKENERKQHKQKQKSGCLKSAVWMAAILAVCITLFFILARFGTDYLGVNFDEDATYDIEFVVEKGTSAKVVANNLKEAGIIKSPLFFRFYAKRHGYDSKFQYGVYYFCKQDSYEDIAEALTEVGDLAEEVEIRIPEGATVDTIAALLEEGKVCKATEFKKAVNAASREKYNYDFMDGVVTPDDGVHYILEGYLYPDTYRFYATGDINGAEQAINKMLSNLDSHLTPEIREQIKASGRTVHDVLTMASVIEMEASIGKMEDKQKVSAVFWNRLNDTSVSGGKLQSDPTMKYPYNTSYYDTYKSAGLAPGAYCSPSADAIYAAAFPEPDCPYFFFVTDKNEQFYFSETLKEHNSTVSRLKKQGLWLVVK